MKPRSLHQFPYPFVLPQPLRCSNNKPKRKRRKHNLTLLPTCGPPASARIGSPLYDIRIGERKALVLVWCWIQKMGIKNTATFSDVSPNTVYRWFYKLRTAAGDIVRLLGPTIWGGSGLMGGPGKAVQVRAGVSLHIRQLTQ